MSVLWVAIFGGLVGLDATAFPQFMFSRPIIAATITGLLLGQPLAGLTIGIVLEAFALVVLPVGAARYPESGTAAVAAAGAFAMVPAAGAGALLLTLVFALFWERVAGGSVGLTRKVNERLVSGDLDARLLERRHLTGMTIDFCRAAVVAVAGLVLGSAVLHAAAPLWALGATTTLAIIGIAATTMLAAVLPLFGGWSERRVSFVVGIALGVLVVMVR